YATVGPCDPAAVAPAPVHLIPDANARRPFRMVWLILRMAWLLLKVRPDVVVTTGAAPGYVAIRLAKLLKAKTVFVDSIANAEKLSLSARLAIPHADVTLTQWPELASDLGPHYWGAVV
ncbi:MAG: UDP-N-acetylglucosamine--LPS N-acetylglucosamine transferase, partial [Planctomycetes bacterium]|nr:UDP-N-acetylglucosamine--LPS N-acetylglucosamine transferase [Planctomycetota bacterium]